MNAPKIPLPKNWPANVQAVILHVISLANYVIAYTRGWAADSKNERIRWKAEAEQATAEVSLLREELRLKDARAARLPAHKRAHYEPTERMAILELRAARGWSMAETSRCFQVCEPTIQSWMGRLDEGGVLVQRF